MRKALSVAAVVIAGVLACGCSEGRKGSAGFHFPDGDVANGRAVFVSMKCAACHRVEGVDLPPPVADPPVPVVLGGRIVQARTDGELVAAIVEPSHRLTSGYRKDAIRAGKLSRMGDFSEGLTVRELVDLVAFLQSTYRVVPPPPMNGGDASL